MARRTKIIATLGPRSRDEDVLGELIAAGVDVVRLNFAHDSLESHARTAKLVQGIAKESGRVIGLMADLPGPKMRTGRIQGDEVRLTSGGELTLVSADVEGDGDKVSTSVDDLSELVSRGDEIYLADGAIVLRVRSLDRGDVVTEVLRGGILRSRKGMHLPSAERSVQAFTAEDRAALACALELEVDLVGLSFIRSADDLDRVRAAVPAGDRAPRLVAKIETKSAAENLEKIIPAADVVMVARGDLGIQVPLRLVPLIQKRIIRVCNEWGRPVITATQMLESMTDAPLPTRAEVTDVANAVLDGTDALMLSEETAVGQDPVSAVRTMSEIAGCAEEALPKEWRAVREEAREDRVSWAVARAAVRAAEALEVAAILCPTRSGATPRRVAASRPGMPVVALSSDHRALGPLALVWGVVPLLVHSTPTAYGLNEEVARVTGAALEAGVVSPGDLVTVVAGTAGPRAGSTDFMRIVRL